MNAAESPNYLTITNGINVVKMLPHCFKNVLAIITMSFDIFPITHSGTFS